MATRGPKPKPVEQHRRAGTYRSDRHGAALAAVTPIDPAEVPESHTVAEVMDQVLADGVHWIARTDAPAVMLLRDLLEERAAVRVGAMAGSTEDRKALRDIDKQVISLLGDLGFNPAARARLGLAEVKAKSKLEELRERQARRS
jgi:hypothetical protein